MTQVPRLYWQGLGGVLGRRGVLVEFVLSFLREQRPLISEVFETFAHFHISILKIDASSGFGYLQALLTQGARAVHCNTISYLLHRAASGRRRAGAWKGIGVT